MPKDSWMAVARFPGLGDDPRLLQPLGRARLARAVRLGVRAVADAVPAGALLNGHLRRDIFTRLKDWRPSAVWHDVREHLRGHFDPDEGKYNFLQKAAYGVVLFILLPLMLITGMAISPGMDAAWPVPDRPVRRAAKRPRSVHFIVAWALFAFFVLHIVLVLLNKPGRNLRDMLTGGRIDEAA
jgi:thiosulfate reductase cytochrome b subunit